MDHMTTHTTFDIIHDGGPLDGRTDELVVLSLGAISALPTYLVYDEAGTYRIVGNEPDGKGRFVYRWVAL
jgi:hypothetical protein